MATDVAIIGMACRFAGACSPEELFDAIAHKHTAASRIPADRMNAEAFYHPSEDRLGSISHLEGYFLSQNIKVFDNSFFGITPAEAAAMDPQQRLLLEVVYESLESAGIPRDSIAGSNTGVYVGSFTRDYHDITSADIEVAPKHAAIGTGLSMLSARISHVFDLKGTSLTLDTACSSSLVALHQAWQAIYSGSNDMAIVGAANLILNPDLSTTMSRMHFFSKDSRCFTFDQQANGYARGEGVAAIILKPLQRALRDNDSIRAIIRGVGSNQDGRTIGITNPSLLSQAELIQSIHQKAGVDPETIGYFEAHG
jgi:acyl transferase domain-containing protein